MPDAFQSEDQLSRFFTASIRQNAESLGSVAGEDSLFALVNLFHRDIQESLTERDALEKTYRYLRSLDYFKLFGLSRVKADTLDFEFVKWHPEESQKSLLSLQMAEVESGRFAWALRQTRPVPFRPINSDSGEMGLMHAISTPQRTYGFFLGLVRDDNFGSREIFQGLLSLFIGSLSHVLERIALNHELSEQNKTLEVKVRQRTRELIATNEELLNEIQQRRMAEKELEVAKLAAEAGNREKGEFLAVMSHEIRTPMNGIIGFANLLADTELDAQQAEYLRCVKTSCDALLVLVNDILDFSKIESGKVELEMRPFALTELVSTLARGLHPSVLEKPVELILDFDPALPSKIVGDTNRLGQVLMNLITNAIKFTNEGEVIVRMRQLDTSVREGVLCSTIQIEVEDTGIGIEQEQKERLFKPFSQGDSSTTRKYGGTGLGLVIVKKLSELMQGTVGFRSQPGRGSLFSFSWMAPVAEKAPAFRIPEIREKVILLGIHNARLRDILIRHLEAMKLDVRVCPADLKAVTLADLLIMDFEWWSKVSNPSAFYRGPHPTLVLGHASRRNDFPFSSFANVTYFLEKPFSQNDLTQILKRLFRPAVVSDSSTPPQIRTRSRQSGVFETDFGHLADRKILVVEDNVFNQKVLQLYLKKMGFKSELAENGQEAFERVQGEPFDLILMDIQMPVMDGLEAARLIRDWEKAERPAWKTTIIAVTANTFNVNREVCVSAGMDDYLKKPVGPHDLKSTLERFIRKS